MQISHIDHIAENTRRLVEAGVLNGNDRQIKLMMEGNTNLQARTIEKKLKGIGITVAELMLARGSKQNGTRKRRWFTLERT